MPRLLRPIRVLVTRPRGQAAGLARTLRAAGMRVLAVPVIRIAPPADPRPLRDAAKRFAEGDYDRIVFTSANSVARFFAALGPRRRPKAARFHAIGPKTAAALEKRSLRVERWPDEHRAEALARRMRVARGERVLLPRAAVAREVLPRMLRRAGARLDVVEAYRTVREKTAESRLKSALLGGNPPDFITFTSSSTAENLAAFFTKAQRRKIFARCRAASIGPITSGALRRLGLKPAVEASPTTAEGLARAILKAAR